MLDVSSQQLFMTELIRGLAKTLEIAAEPKVSAARCELSTVKWAAFSRRERDSEINEPV